ncbi:TonB-dependent siderophore receptor [Tardiphaga alba]|uniref:TonB-dependent siderophore receptor n=1 Tax=Tardiphaga alba TaxID=340268 RepID=A0ABX8AHR7_9BRAD|nr:TonB-dependent siderophore receptor [Tardiphaga alba]QUS42491.1 TonB-dependent siderophore receptor [Tardiphaga alba]
MMACASLAQAQTSLPPVTVESSTQTRRPARATATPSRSRAVAARRNTTPPPAPPTATERAIAAAAVRYEQVLGYRAMPSATTLRSGQPPLNSSQTVNVVPEQVIKDQLPRNLDDALANVSGITQTNTLAGTQDAVMRRGFGDNRDGSIMRNGLPLVQGRSLNAAVESVEVLKGPASLLYGIIDPGGIVNTISKRPDLYQHGSVTLLGSTFGNGKNGIDGTADITGPIGSNGLAYRFIAYGQSEDYWRNFGLRKETLIAPSLSWYGDDTTVHLNYEYRDFSYPFDRGTSFIAGTSTPLQIPRERRLDEAYNNMWGKSHLIQASVDHRINENWKLYASYSYNTEMFDANQLRINSFNPTTGAMVRNNDGTKGSLSNVSAGVAYLRGDVNIGGFRNEVLFGGDAQYRSIYREYLIRGGPSNFNMYNPVYGVLQPSSIVGSTESAQTDLLGMRGLFFQDTFYLTNQLLLVGGVRWLEYEQLAGRGRSPSPFITNTNLAGSKALPIGGVIYKITDEVSWYLSYTESLKPTSAINIFPGASTGFTIGSDLLPEEGVQWETGIKFDVNKRLSGNIAVFDIDKKNVLVAIPVGGGVNAIRTAGKVRSRGVELDLTGRLTDNVSVIGSYGYTDARVTEDPTLIGKGLLNVALNTASLFMVYDFGTALPGRLRVGGGARYVGDRPGDSTNTYMLPSYTVADAFASYEVKQNGFPVIYQFNVKNLFDKTYYPSAVNNTNVAIGDVRRFSLEATVKF